MTERPVARPGREGALLRNKAAVGYCLNRAAECGHLATLADDWALKQRHLRLAESWLKLANSSEFTDKLDAHLAGAKAS